MKKNKTEQLFGIPPNAITCYEYFTVHKSAKKGQNSFRITKSLLDSLLNTSNKIQKKPKLIITIQDGSDEYTLTINSILKSKG
jgi:hypothetical protein